MKCGGVRNSKRSKHLFLKLIIKPGNNDYVQRSEIVAAEVSAIPTANKCNSSIFFFFLKVFTLILYEVLTVAMYSLQR